METCIFCPSTLNQDTKPEHILHRSLGGRKTTKRVVCSDCNNKFGGGIDKVLVEQFAEIRHLLQLPSGSGNPPVLKRVKAGNDIIDIAGDGKIRLVEKPFLIACDPDGNKRLQINGESLTQINTMIPNMAAAVKIPEDRLREIISSSEASFTERRPDPIRLGFSFGGAEAMRAAAKSCLVLWATLVGNSEVKGKCYESVRQFIKNGSNEFLSARTYLDSRIFESDDQITAAYSPVFNLIYLRSSDTGRVVGHFTFYNQIGFSVVLAESSGFPDRKIALISNPLTRAWSGRFADELDVPFEWLDNANYDYDDTQWLRQRFNSIMKLHFAMSNDQWLRHIISDVLNGHGLKEGDLIPKEMALSVSKEVSERVTHHVFNLPYKKSITPDQMRKAFGTEPTKTE